MAFQCSGNIGVSQTPAGQGQGDASPNILPGCILIGNTAIFNLFRPHRLHATHRYSMVCVYCTLLFLVCLYCFFCLSVHLRTLLPYLVNKDVCTMRPIATDVARSVVCMLSTRLSSANLQIGRTDRNAVLRANSSWSKEPCLRRGPDSFTRRGTYDEAHVPAHHNVPTAGAGECACPANECIRRHQG